MAARQRGLSTVEPTLSCSNRDTAVTRRDHRYEKPRRINQSRKKGGKDEAAKQGFFLSCFLQMVHRHTRTVQDTGACISSRTG